MKRPIKRHYFKKPGQLCRTGSVLIGLLPVMHFSEIEQQTLCCASQSGPTVSVLLACSTVGYYFFTKTFLFSHILIMILVLN